MPLSVGLAEGSAKCAEASTKVCCGSEKFAVGAAGLEKCGGW